MAFCLACVYRGARCLRQCRREADGKHLWAVMRDDRLHGRLPPMHEPEYEALPLDVRHNYEAGAAAMRAMER